MRRGRGKRLRFGQREVFVLRRGRDLDWCVKARRDVDGRQREGSRANVIRQCGIETVELVRVGVCEQVVEPLGLGSRLAERALGKLDWAARFVVERAELLAQTSRSPG